MECQRLRVQDLDFSRDEITVRDGKGGKDLAEGWGRGVRSPLDRL